MSPWYVSTRPSRWAIRYSGAMVAVAGMMRVMRMPNIRSRRPRKSNRDNA